jgi:signal transduction histidine kinase
MRYAVARSVSELGHLSVALLVGLAGLLALVLTVIAVPTTVIGIGLFVALVAVGLTRRLAGWQRGRAAAVLGRPVLSPYRPVPRGLLGRIRGVVGDPASWRDIAWLPVHLLLALVGMVVALGLWFACLECLTAPGLLALLPEPTGFDPVVLDLTRRSVGLSWLAVAVGAALLPLAYRLPRLMLRAQALLAAALLGPTAASELTRKVGQLSASRNDARDAAAAELRRVERDLHDGAQARLVALSLSLGMAEDIIDVDPTGAKALLGEARTHATASLAELRDLVRGIHPPLLADRGLAGAVEALALNCPLPASVRVELSRRLSPPVESAAFFAIAEALVNAVRHSVADQVDVKLSEAAGVLRIVVRDDGRGGADPARGTGLRGIARRLSAFDGTLHIDSPANGPTVLTMEVPCAS